LDAANSGTLMRLLAGLVAAHPFRTVLGGDQSLSRRPMRRVIAPLTSMGATIASRDGCPPLTIDGADLRAIDHAPEVPSAQVKSAVLLAGLHAAGRTTVREPAPTRDHTERALEAFGARVERDGPRVAIEGVGLNPTRTAVLDVFRRAGAAIETAPERTAGGEPVGSLHVQFGDVRPVEILPAEVPGLIDEIPALAALAAMTEGGALTVRGAGELRVKESDRITMLARGFRSMGVTVDEFADGFHIEGGPPRGGDADAAGDHRLAMAFAIAATRARSPIAITGTESAAVSYPGFFDELHRFGAR